MGTGVLVPDGRGDLTETSLRGLRSHSALYSGAIELGAISFTGARWRDYGAMASSYLTLRNEL